MKKVCALIVSLLIAAVVLCGCDPSGLLTEDETQELYEELCGDFSEASVWDMDIEIWNDMLKNKDVYHLSNLCVFCLSAKVIA